MARRKVVVDFGLWGALTAPSISSTWRGSGRRARSASRRSCRSPTRVPERHRRRVPRGHAHGRAGSAGSCSSTPRTTRCCSRTSRGCARRAARRDGPPRVAAAVHRGGGGAPRALPGRHAGARLQVVHTSSPVTVDLVEARERGRASAATMEVCPHHLLLDLDDYARLGPFGLLRAADPRPRARRGDVGARARRHGRLPRLRPRRLHARREGAGLRRHLRPPLGCQVIQETVPAVLSEAFHRHGMPLDAFARFSSTNARARSRPVPAQGHDPAGLRRRPRRSGTSTSSGSSTPSRSSSRRTRGRRSTAASAGARRAHDRARHDRLPDGEIAVAPGLRRVPLGARRLLARELTLFAATFREYGGPERMLWEEIPDPCAAPTT